MLIDWFTVAAQVLNFLILAWLLKLFLYRPILNAIDAREERIANELADADSMRAEALQERSEFQKKNEAFDKQRAMQLEQLAQEVRAERQRRLEEARQAGDAMLAKRRERMDSDARHLQLAINRRAQEEVFAIARKALTDLAETSLEHRMAGIFMHRLRQLEAPALEGLRRALQAEAGPVLLRSAFELPADDRAALQQALNEAFSTEVPLRFETAPDVISGIELIAGGQKLGWSIAEYLRSLEQGVNATLSAQLGPVTSGLPAADPGPGRP
jgi:F-type H+-transporting ATPase subunit b